MATDSTQDINDLPDSDFAYIEPGGKLDSEGKTVPRSLRHFPIQDEAHVRNALARLSSSPFGEKARPKVEAAAKKFGIDVGGKALMPLKAKPIDDHEAFFAGKVPWRLLAIPFGGPIPSPYAPRGVDLDGEWFSERTDIFAGHKALLETRERYVDWHHGQDKVMGHTILGKAILDEEPDEDGWWVDLWMKHGEKRVELVKKLFERGAQIFGSSAALHKEKAETGEITSWSYYLQTLSTSPQNVLSAFRGKAVLEAITESGYSISPAMTRLIATAADLEADLRVTAAKAGRELSGSNEAEIEAVLEEIETSTGRARALLERIRAKYRKESNG